MLNRDFWRPVVLLVAIACYVRPATAQDAKQVSNCVNGAPELTAADGQPARDALARLLWRSSHSDYVKIQSTRGAPVAFDSIVARSEVLFGLTKGSRASPLDGAVSTLRQRLATARSELTVALGPDSLAAQRPIDATPLNLSPDDDNPSRSRLGGDVNIDIDSVTRPIAAAICASGGTASRFLEYLMEPRLKEIAKSYVDATKHWDLFVEGGYSMTFVERLAASCRLWFAGRLINPLRNCSRAPGRSLEPPSHQIVFVHPSAGVAPLFKGDSVFQQLAIVEWYGYMHHSYGDARVYTFGLAFASSHAEVGPSRHGGVLRTPWGSAGVFARKSERPLYTVSADVLGWVPGVRNAARALRLASFERAVSTLAEPR